MEDLLTIFDEYPVLESERLLLRRITRDDASDMFEYARDPSVTRYLLWNPHPSPDYTRRYVDDLKRQYREHEFFDFALVLKSENKMIGTCGFTRLDPVNSLAEIGYVLNAAYWHRQLATEAVALILRFALCDLGLNRVEARYMVENSRSRAVMEKNGMTFEGVHAEALFVKGRFCSIGTCAILRRDFVSRFGGHSTGWYRALPTHASRRLFF